MAHGPITRVLTAAPAFVLKEWALSGSYRVEAIFQPTEGATVAEDGVTVGGPGAWSLTCVVRPDGFAAVRLEPVAASLAWTPLTERGQAPVLDRVVVQVTETETVCRVNGQEVARVPTKAAHLAGQPGVYIGPGSDVQVSGFTVQSATLSPPSSR